DRPYNIKTSTSKYFRITGGDTEGYYGINLRGSISDGIVLTDLSSDFEVDHLEIHHVGFAGMMAKTDPTCDDATIRGNYTMRNVLLHDNFIHDTAGEGFYLGSSSYGGTEVDGCGTRLPHTIENISVYNNHVLRSGWDGIQLSCATVGAAIYGNVVENYGVKDEPSQQNGILMGGGTGGVCYGNLINGGTGVGICTFGLGDNVFHDNIVINAGDKGFFCDERGTPTGDGFKYINNTVINPKDIGIAIYSETLPNNVCINNIIVKANGSDDKSYITTLHNAPTVKSNNFTTTKIGDLLFLNAKGINYRLKTGSPIIDQGTDISSYNIGLDFYKSKRKNGTAYDIGASEF
ncbi:MAG TPA: right-handed parallel beta-helix repeat-containing protein, partial [Cyclobacteriaceae bacterium]